MRVELERRPTLIACAGLLVGMAFKLDPILLIYLALALWFVRPVPVKSLLILMFFVGWWIAPAPATELVRSAQEFAGTVRIASVPEIYGDSYAADVQVDAVRLRMTWKSKDLSLGDKVQVMGVLEPLREGSRDMALVEGIQGRLRAESEPKIVRQGSPFFRAGIAWRRAFVNLSRSALSPEASAQLEALAFNVTGGLTEDYKKNLQTTGTIHIISASGAHVVIIAVPLLFALSQFPVPRWLQVALLILILAIYAGGAGFRPPIVRAVVMAAFFYGAYMVQREPDILSALGASMLGFLLWRPESIHQIGFQLSFFTVGGLALAFQNPLGDSGGVWSKILLIAKASFFASLASAPLVAYHFGMVSIIGIVANVAIALFIAPILVLAMVAAGIYPVIPVLSVKLLQLFADPWLRCTEWIVASLARVPFAALDVPEFSAYWLGPIYATLLMLWRKHARPA